MPYQPILIFEDADENYCDKLFSSQKFDGKNIDKIVLGIGQVDIVINRIYKATVSGKWIVLLNCHLAPDVISKLDEIILDLSNK